MPKELIYLLCGEEREPANFLKKVHNLIHIPLKGKETFDDLFAALEAEFHGQAENLEAAKTWIKFFQQDTPEDILNGEVLDVIPAPGIKFYAIFDLVPL